MTTRTVLIVEDEPSLALTFQHILKDSLDYHYQITAVESAEDGLQAIERSTPFDVILLDIFLPGQSGVEFLRTVRSFNNDSAIICISGTQDYKIVHDVFKLGADDFISKTELQHLYILEKSIFASLEKRQYQKQMTKQEITTQRLDAITTIIRTIHHELNNPLAIIRLASSKISSHASLTPDEIKEYALEIQDNVDRMSEVLRRLPLFREELFNDQLRGLKLFALPKEPEPPKQQ